MRIETIYLTKKQKPIQFLRKYTGKIIPNYKDPDNLIIEHYRNFITALHNNDEENIDKHMEILDLKGIIFKKKGRKFKWIVYVPNDMEKVHINLYWRYGDVVIPSNKKTFKNNVDSMILQAPHEGTDNTFPTALNCFILTRCRALISNAVHNKCGLKGVRCQAKRFHSDGAHNTGTLFHQAVLHLSKIYPYATFPQLHGMKGSVHNQMLVSNCFKPRFDIPEKSAPLYFGKACAIIFKDPEQKKTFLFAGKVTDYEDEFTRHFKTPTSNVTANGLNYGNQCRNGKADTGRFIHLELGPTFRITKYKNYKENIKNLTMSLNLLMKLWNL